MSGQGEYLMYRCNYPVFILQRLKDLVYGHEYAVTVSVPLNVLGTLQRSVLESSRSQGVILSTVRGYVSH